MFNFFKNKKTAQPEKKKSFNLSSSGGWQDFFNENERDFSNWKTSWFYTGATIIAENFAKGKVLMYQKKGKTVNEVSSHPFLNIVQGSNKFDQDFYELMYLVALDLRVHGQAYLYAVAGTKGVPAEFRNLTSECVSIVLTRDKSEVSYYEFSNGGSRTKFLPEEIIHFRLPVLGSPVEGDSAVKNMKNVIEIDNIQGFFQRKFTLTGGNINEVITSDSELDDEDIDRLNETMKDKQDLESESTWLILQNMKYEKVKTSAKDLDFTNGKTQIRDEILRKLRIPDVLTGGNSANYATAKIQVSSFIENVIKPFSKFIINKFNIWIKKTYGNEYYITMEWETTDPKDDAELYDMLLSNQVIEPEEVRPIYGFGDKKPAGK